MNLSGKWHIWDKVFKNGASKICGRQPLNNLKGYGLPKQKVLLSVFQFFSNFKIILSSLWLSLNLQKNLFKKFFILKTSWQNGWSRSYNVVVESTLNMIYIHQAEISLEMGMVKLFL